MERFGVQEVYGMHNMPGLPVGHFAIRPGPMMAAADRFTITIEGKGGHAARPHDCIDPILVGEPRGHGAAIDRRRATSTRSNRPWSRSASFKAGEAFNVIPQTATLLGTVRTLDDGGARPLRGARSARSSSHVCAAFGATATVDY